MASVTQLRIVATTIGGVSQILTAARIYYGRRADLLWLDDLFAAGGMAFSFLGLVCYWIMTDINGTGPFVQKDYVRANASWVVNMSWMSVFWFSKISIAYFCTRIASNSQPSNAKHKRACYAVTSVFGLMWLSSVAQRIFLCERNPSWRDMDFPVCRDFSMRVTTISFELASDLALIILPTIIVLQLNLSLIHRKLLCSVACLSIIPLGLSIAQAVLELHEMEDLELLMSIAQNGVSLMLANLPLVYILYEEKSELVPELHDENSRNPIIVHEPPSQDGHTPNTTDSPEPVTPLRPRCPNWLKFFGWSHAPKNTTPKSTTHKTKFLQLPFLSHRRALRSSTSFFTADPGGHVRQPSHSTRLSDFPVPPTALHSPSTLSQSIDLEDLKIFNHKQQDSLSTAATGTSGSFPRPPFHKVSYSSMYRPYLAMPEGGNESFRLARRTSHDRNASSISSQHTALERSEPF